MRLLVLVSLAWIAGMLLPCSPWWLLVGAGAMILALRGSAPGLALAALAGGALAGGVPAEAVAERRGLLEGVVARPVEDLPGQRRVVVELDDGVRVLVTERAPRIALLAGDRVRFAGVARHPPTASFAGAFDRARWLAGRGIALEALAAAPGLTRVDAPAAPSAWRLASWARDRAARALAAAASGDGAALLQALVLGRRGDVRRELEEAFQRAGVAHVLSVSGVHLAAATLLVLALARLLARRSAWLVQRLPVESAAALAAIPAAIAYTLLTGAETATVRALVCVLVVLVGRVLGRASDALTALAAAALGLLAASPRILYEPSFQLSFAAAAGLALVAPRLRGRGRLVSALVASLAATATTAPFSALAFGVVQPGGIVANLIVVPLAELVVLPLGLLGALLGMVRADLGASFVALGALAAEGLARLVVLLASVLPVWTVPPPRPVELVAWCVGVAALLAGPWRRGLAVAALAAAVALAAPGPSPPPGLTVTFLDVGQGDAALIETPAGEHWLIDAGGRLFGDAGPDPGDQVRRMLAARRIDRLDLVVLSHPHPDHYGGLAALVGHVTLGDVWISGDDAGDVRWEVLRARLPARVVAAGAARSDGGARLQVLAPPAPDPLRSVNDNSLVVAVSYAGRRMLFTGDVEAGGEDAWLDGGGDAAADVVKVAHHGSRTSSSARFVAAAHPRLAVVSCGRDNRFGFPAPEVVARWQAQGTEVLRTDERGAITVHVTPDGALDWTSGR